MIARLVAASVRWRRLVLVVGGIVVLGGAGAYRELARDAVPELADPRIVVQADWMGHPATDVATAVTGVLTTAIDGTPGSTAVRGTSMAGMAFVEVVLGSVSDLPTARAALETRIDAARSRLPPSATVRVGPPASSTGWVLEYVLVDPRRLHPLAELRHIQEEVLRPALASLTGVAEVATVGAGRTQLRVDANTPELAARRIALFDLVAPLRAAATSGEPLSPRLIEDLPIPGGSTSAIPRAARLGEVARARVAVDMAMGAADYNGVLPAIGGIVIARAGADVAQVAAQAKTILDEQRARLPKGVELVTVYDRSELSTRIEKTLVRALCEEVSVVVAVALLFLLSARAALVPLGTLPLVLALTFVGMWAFRVPATVMSLGGIAIALGMAVDADLVALEACARQLEAQPPAPGERRRRLLAAAAAFAPAILTSLVIAAIAFLPVLVLPGENGRLVRPLAITKTLVVAAAALVSVIAAPVLRDRLLGQRAPAELANPVTRTLVRLYQPFVHFALERPKLTLVTAALALASCLPLLPRLGGEFFPRLDEGDLLYMPVTRPGVMLEDAEPELGIQDRILAGFDEVASVFGKVGRADSATDPAPPSMIETTIRLKPRTAWPRYFHRRWYSDLAPDALKPALRLAWPEQTPSTQAELIERLDAATRRPGWTNAWTSPVRARMDMMSTGIRTPVGIRIVSADLVRLDTLGEQVRALAQSLSGTRSAAFESLGGEPWPRLVPDPAVLAAVGADTATVERAADFFLSGGEIGAIRLAGSSATSGGPAVRLRLLPDSGAGRLSDRLAGATVRVGGDGATQPAPLGLLGAVRFVNRPALVRTERGESVAYVYVDLVEGTDLAEYVARGKRAIATAAASGAIDLRAGERIEWAGQYELLAAGQRRLVLIVPLVALSMFGLLLLQFRSLAEALIVLSSVPFAIVGSLWTLFLTGFPLSAPVWVGLLSVVGLAMQTGVVMVVYVDEAFHRRLRAGAVRSRADIVAAHAEGAARRLRPKLMTITAMAAALLPLLWTDGAGAEIMKRVAAPMLGGLVTSGFLTLEVLPVLCTIWRSSQLRRAARTGRPLAELVGRAPAHAREP